MIAPRPALAALLPLALTALVPGALAAQDAAESDVATEAAAAEPTKGEKRLAKLLEGRVAGEPQRCIRTFGNQRMQTIEGTAYVYGSGNTIYVQRTQNPELIDDNDVLIVNRFDPVQLCRLDQARTVDRVLGFFTGAVLFEEFVPYTRTKAEDGASEG